MTVRDSPFDDRRWDIAKTQWNAVSGYLDDGWEPFAVVQRQPNSHLETTQEIVYLRRERKETDRG